MSSKKWVSPIQKNKIKVPSEYKGKIEKVSRSHNLERKWYQVQFFIPYQFNIILSEDRQIKKNKKYHKG
jgi:DNA-binding transcriptional regulator WhiA